MKDRKRLMAAAIEAMESRQLLSGTGIFSVAMPPIYHTPTPTIQPQTTGDPAYSQVGGLTAAQLRGAYGEGQFNASSFTFYNPSSGTYAQGDGTGQIIAIVDANNDPNIATDLTTFDASEGLPAPASFQVLNVNGAASPLPSNDVQNPNSSSDWAVEESLDVEMAHAMAPGAGIIVFEGTASNLPQCDAEAVAYPGVTVVSNSWGGGESSGETSEDGDFVAPVSHPGVTVLAATGDTGGEVIYPAMSPDVVAVGGTQLTVSGNNWSSETAWTDGGGGVSSYEAKPAYQNTVNTGTKREDPDISIAGGQNSGSSNSFVDISDSWDYGSGTSWTGVEGTSWATPMAAGIVAVADQGRALEGLGSLSSTQTLTRLYQLSAANFHDITTGSNGHSALVGYDEATGIGTPIASQLVPDLAGTATVTGRVFVDNVGNGTYGTPDRALASQGVYLNLNADSSDDNSEPGMNTSSAGIYTFADEPAGGKIQLTAPTISGYTLTNSSAVSQVYGSAQTVNFIYQANSASQLVITQQPAASTNGGTVMNPVIVTAENANGDTDFGTASTVTLTLSTGTFSTGSNTATATTVNGVATFSNLQINAGGTYTFTATDGTLTSAATNSFAIIAKSTPTVSWIAPASIAYGTGLTSTQLDATASVPGTFVYTPAAGTVLLAGANQSLSVVFTPTDTTDYYGASGSTTITISKATPTLQWAAPTAIGFGTALTSTQLDATAGVPGTFVYTPPAGTVLSSGAGQVLGVVFTPTDTADYTTASGSAAITVQQATPTITWANPLAVTYGTALTGTQLDATANVPGTFVYTPAAGTVLTAGTSENLGVVFTPTDSIDYANANGSAAITIQQATPTITWANPSSITYGTTLSSTQLDATANVPGTFIYTPAAGTVLTAGIIENLGVVFTPTDSTDYADADGSAAITVQQATPNITWANPSSITYGTALSSAQLNATANVAGTFVYTPTAGTVLNAGAGQTLSTVFTPTDNTDFTTNSASVAITVTTPVSQPINLTGSTFYLRLDNATPQNLDIWTNATASGLPADVQPFSGVSSITLSATAAGDSFTADFSNGSVVPTGGLTINGYGSSAANSLTLVGSGGSDTVATPETGIVTLNGNAVTYFSGSIGTVYYAPTGASQALTVASGNLTLAAGASTGVTTDEFSSITIAAGADLAVPMAATHATRMLVETGALNIAGITGAWTGTLDVANNDLDVANGSLTALNSQVAHGFVAGSGGIISSAVQNDSTHLTTLGVIQNSVDGTPGGSPLYGNGAALGTFDGANPASTDVLVKYTYYGDANLSGMVDGADYTRIDAAYVSHANGWFNGDFNDDGVVDGSDYALIDNAYNTQGASLAAEIATPGTKPAAKLAAQPNQLFSQVPVTSPQTWATPESIATSIFSPENSKAKSRASLILDE